MSRLKHYRKKFKFTQTDIARKLNVSPQAVRDREICGIGTLRTAKRYAKAFPGLRAIDLLDED